MAQEKLVTTPEIPADQVRHLVGGAIYFPLPQPGHLMVAEFGKLPCARQFPMCVRSYPWPWNDPMRRPSHAHTTGQELFVCFQDTVEVELSDGDRTEEVLLIRGWALFIPTWVWHQVRALNGGTMCVYADTPYDREQHYMEDFASFREAARKRRAEQGE